MSGWLPFWVIRLRPFIRPCNQRAASSTSSEPTSSGNPTGKISQVCWIHSIVRPANEADKIDICMHVRCFDVLQISVPDRRNSCFPSRPHQLKRLFYHQSKTPNKMLLCSLDKHVSSAELGSCAISEIAFIQAATFVPSVKGTSECRARHTCSWGSPAKCSPGSHGQS